MHRFTGRRRGLLAALATTAGLLVLAAPAAHADTLAFTATGTTTWVVPAGVTSVTVDAFGGRGGNSITDSQGADGARAVATIAVTPGETLEIRVGGRGGDGGTGFGAPAAAGGVNGGGAGGRGFNGPSVQNSGGGGGGGSDVRRSPNALTDRLVVAGGGGGGGSGNGTFATGGAGAGLTGGDGITGGCTGDPGLGGTQAGGGAGGTCAGGSAGNPGATGVGGSATDRASVTARAGGGGGGGYFGGGGGAAADGTSGGAGGGGSSFGPGGVAFTSGSPAANSGDGKVTLTWSIAVAVTPSAPRVPSPPVTGPATEVTATSAVLHGTLDAVEAYHFDQGQVAAGTYTESTPAATAARSGEVAAVISGLQPLTTYRFRISSASGLGAELTFVTRAIPVTGAATGVTTSGAVLHGAVGVAGEAYCYEYGTSTSYGTTTPTGAGSVGDLPTTIAGLVPGTTYHVRIVAPLSGSGADSTFTTRAMLPTASNSPFQLDGSTVLSPGGSGRRGARLVASVLRPGGGHWALDADGVVTGFGGAPALGSATRPGVVSIATTPTGAGYWVASADGSVEAFGDAAVLGSMQGRHLNRPIVEILPLPTGTGYLLVAGDGGVFTFGGVRFTGSGVSRKVTEPVIGGAVTSSGRGYWLLGATGSLFAFGDARFLGRGTDAARAVFAMPTGNGYVVVDRRGRVTTLGS